MVAPVTAISPFLSSEEGITEVTKSVGGEHPFQAILDRAIDSLNNVSGIENHANYMIDQYIMGKADLSEVMLATSKMGIAVQLAVTTITTSVNSFKEITQMQV